jgi:hypothetical protein
MIPEESEILCDIFFLLSISNTEPYYLLVYICIVDEQYLLGSVFVLRKPISINHDMVYIWIYLTDTGNRIVIKARLDILTNPIFIESFLIGKLPR